MKDMQLRQSVRDDKEKMENEIYELKKQVECIKEYLDIEIQPKLSTPFWLPSIWELRKINRCPNCNAPGYTGKPKQEGK